MTVSYAFKHGCDGGGGFCNCGDIDRQGGTGYVKAAYGGDTWGFGVGSASGSLIAGNTWQPTMNGIPPKNSAASGSGSNNQPLAYSRGVRMSDCAATQGLAYFGLGSPPGTRGLGSLVCVPNGATAITTLDGANGFGTTGQKVSTLPRADGRMILTDARSSTVEYVYYLAYNSSGQAAVFRGKMTSGSPSGFGTQIAVLPSSTNLVWKGGIQVSTTQLLVWTFAYNDSMALTGSTVYLVTANTDLATDSSGNITVSTVTGHPYRVDDMVQTFGGSTVYACAGPSSGAGTVYKVSGASYGSWTDVGGGVFDGTPAAIDAYHSGGNDVVWVGQCNPGAGWHHVAKASNPTSAGSWSWMMASSKINSKVYGSSTLTWWLWPSGEVPGKTSYEVHQLRVDPNNPNAVYCFGRSGIWLTDDGAVTWRPAMTGLNGSDCPSGISGTACSNTDWGGTTSTDHWLTNVARSSGSLSPGNTSLGSSSAGVRAGTQNYWFYIDISSAPAKMMMSTSSASGPWTNVADSYFQAAAINLAGLYPDPQTSGAPIICICLDGGGTLIGRPSTSGGAVPTPPTSVAASALDSTDIKVTWSGATAGTGGTISDYRIYNSGTLLTTATSSPATIGGLTPNTTYSITVTTVDTDGNESTPSSPAVNVTTPTSSGPEPQPPSTVTATAKTSSSIKVSWSGASDPGGTISGYKIVQVGVGVIATVGVVGTFTVTGLAASTAYSFEVETIDASGTVSAASAAASATTLSGSGSIGTPFTAITPGTSTTNSSTITVTTSADVPAGDTLFLCVAQRLGGQFTVASVTGQPAGNWLISGAYQTGHSSSISLCALNAGVDIPSGTNLTITFGGSTSRVAYGGWGVSGLAAQEYTASGADSASSGALATLPVAPSGTEFVIAAYEHDLGGSTDTVSATSGFTLLGHPIAGTSSWCELIVEYVISSSSQTGAPTTSDTSQNWVSFIAAYAASGGTGSANPQPPTSVSAEPLSQTSVKVSWSGATDSGGTIEDYKVFEVTQGLGLVGTTSGTAETLTVTGLTAGTTYGFQVETVDISGAVSSNSATASATTTSAGSGGAFIQAVSGAFASSAAWSVTLNAATPHGRAIFVALRGSTKARGFAAVTDSAGNSYTQIGPIQTGTSSCHLECWLGFQSQLLPETLTVTATPSSAEAGAMIVCEFNLGSAGVVDQQAGTDDAAITTAHTTPTISTLNASDMLVAAIAYDLASGAAPFTPSGAWQSAGVDIGGHGASLGVAYQPVSVTGSYSATMTASGSTGAAASLVIVSLTANSSGGVSGNQPAILNYGQWMIRCPNDGNGVLAPIGTSSVECPECLETFNPQYPNNVDQIAQLVCYRAYQHEMNYDATRDTTASMAAYNTQKGYLPAPTSITAAEVTR